MKRIFIAASLLLAAVFAGALMGRAYRSQPQPVHGKAMFQKPGSTSRRRPGSSAAAGTAIWKIVNTEGLKDQDRRTTNLSIGEKFTLQLPEPNNFRRRLPHAENNDEILK